MLQDFNRKQFSEMLAFICNHTEPGHKNNSDKPEKKCEPINGIDIGYEQEHNRFTQGNLRRERNKKRNCYTTYR